MTEINKKHASGGQFVTLNEFDFDFTKSPSIVVGSTCFKTIITFTKLTVPL